jgi:hypothetical protein
MTGGIFCMRLLNTIFILFLAAFFNGFSKHSLCLLVVYVLLIPSIVIAATDINVSDHLKKIFHLIYQPYLFGFSAFICTEERLVWLKLMTFY